MIDILANGLIDSRVNKGATPTLATPRIHETCRIIDSTLGQYVHLGANTSIV